jgi:serine/threonine protein phosphatase PrpC
MISPGTRPPRAGRLVVTGAGLTHRGRVRELNEDAILTDPAGALWAIADGMGGHGHGDLAADLVIDALARLPHGGGGRGLLQDGFADAHAEVRRRARADGLGAIGATVVALLVDGDRATVAWAGDSRAYLMRGGEFAPLTRDHSVVQELIDRGALAPEAAALHPQAHVVTRAVGAGDRAEPAFAEVGLRAGDVVLLCSDGLTRCVPDAAIAELLAAAPDPEAACRALVEATLAAGAPDNVSTVVVRVDGVGP